MTNTELIAELRGHIREVPLTLLRAAADALEAAEKRIAELEDELRFQLDTRRKETAEIERLKAENLKLQKQNRDCGWNCKQCEYVDKDLQAEESEQRLMELEAQIPKEGEWIEDDTTYCGADRANYKCSLCGKIGGTWRRGLKQDELPPFCGSCGARMKTVTDCHTLEEGER